MLCRTMASHCKLVLMLCLPLTLDFKTFFSLRLVSHYYGHGDVCDLTGKPRQVIVKLKWVFVHGTQPVFIELLEDNFLMPFFCPLCQVQGVRVSPCRHRLHAGASDVSIYPWGKKIIRPITFCFSFLFLYNLIWIYMIGSFLLVEVRQFITFVFNYSWLQWLFLLF